MTQSFIGDGILVEFDGYCVQLSCKNVNGYVDVITLNLHEWGELKRFMNAQHAAETEGPKKLNPLP